MNHRHRQVSSNFNGMTETGTHNDSPAKSFRVHVKNDKRVISEMSSACKQKSNSPREEFPNGSPSEKVGNGQKDKSDSISVNSDGIDCQDESQKLDNSKNIMSEAGSSDEDESVEDVKDLDSVEIDVNDSLDIESQVFNL